MPEFGTELRYVKGVGEARARAFGRLGVHDLAGLVSFFPRAYEDRTRLVRIAELADGDLVCVEAVVGTEPQLSRIRRGLDLLRFRAVDETGAMQLTFFNQAYLKDQFRKGESYVFYGRAQVKGRFVSMTNPVFDRLADFGRVTGRIVPVYRLTSGLSQNTVRSAVRQALDLSQGRLPDGLPDCVADEYKLCTARYAYENVHFPADMQALSLARRRLVFEELFVLACALGLLRGGREGAQGRVLRGAGLGTFTGSLPFSPTGAQLRAMREAIGDMSSGKLMNRLVQGDVGSGKTLVAAACIWYAAQSGAQSAFMAPTEILAEQHYATLTGFLEPFGIRVAKLTGSMRAAEKRAVLSGLASGEYALCVGTHALLSGGVEFRDLALVVTDEQHRFGVQQRAALAEKGLRPHILVMSATPIPRTLALMIYGELDVSLIDELPPGRQKVDTFAVDESYRARLGGFIEKLVSEGRQVFVVCPRIEEGEEAGDGLKSAEEHAEELRQQLPGLRIACIHGKLKAREKDEIMSRFAAGETDVLVSTTVIEVGVDVPNAALMVVENAERFGLSQLHQLRGRVGRGKHKSWCILVSDAKGEEARARLSAMTHISDGFKIAEEDLRLRGPGDFFGSRQHGLPELHIADLGADMNVLKAAQDAAKRLLDSDPRLERPENKRLRSRAGELLAASGDRFN
ncbi:MAG TPA: ATP-dependent DNA helicase RecG [Candidatus Scatomorpha merdavium]|nr:ATP-dependent DNA helicase RecG [Candidatus Scatomorpha merdavium]